MIGFLALCVILGGIACLCGFKREKIGDYLKLDP